MLRYNNLPIQNAIETRSSILCNIFEIFKRFLNIYNSNFGVKAIQKSIIFVKNSQWAYFC